MALRSAGRQKEQISLSGPDRRRHPLHQTRKLPLFSLKPARLNNRASMITSNDSRRLSHGHGRSRLGGIKLPFSLTNCLLKVVGLAQVPSHSVLCDANCMPMERAICVWSVDTCATLREAQGLWYTL